MLGGASIQIISRIENTSAINEIDEIIKLSDGLCIDCEKLMVELPKEKVFLVQKSILAKCNLAGKYLCNPFRGLYFCSSE